MSQNEAPVDFVLFAYIMKRIYVNYGRFFDVLESLQIAQSLQISLETVAHYLEAILKVSGQTRVSE